MSTFDELLKECSSQCTTPLILFLDGLDLLDDVYQAQTLEWIPESIPQVCLYNLIKKPVTLQSIAKALVECPVNV